MGRARFRGFFAGRADTPNGKIPGQRWPRRPPHRTPRALARGNADCRALPPGSRMVIASPELLDILRRVKDPEVPVLDVVELGIVRSVERSGDSVTVEITPTYSGCPALKVIEDEIIGTLKSHGYGNVTVRTVYSPAWSTDWLSDATKEKLRNAGIAPPHAVEAEPLILLHRAALKVECPYCGSSNTEEKSEFGSTACKAIHFCNSCRQPFDRFKSL